MVFPLTRSPVVFTPNLNAQLRAEREELLGKRFHMWHIVNLVDDFAGFLGDLVAVQMDRTIQVLRPDIRTAVHLQLNAVFIGHQSGIQNFLFLRRGILHGLPKTIGFIKSFHCISFQHNHNVTNICKDFLAVSINHGGIEFGDNVNQLPTKTFVTGPLGNNLNSVSHFHVADHNITPFPFSIFIIP